MFDYRKQFTLRPAAVLSLGLLFGVAGCRQPDTAEVQQTNTTVATDGATVAEIVASPTAWHGKTVTVSGGVNRLHGPRSFTLGDEGLLVITSQPLSDDVKVTENSVVQISGTVQNFVEKEIESQIGMTLEDDVYVNYENKPVVVAQTVDITDQQTEVTNKETNVTNKETNVTVVKPEQPDKDVTVVQPDSPDKEEVNVNQNVDVNRPKQGGNTGGQSSPNQGGQSKQGQNNSDTKQGTSKSGSDNSSGDAKDKKSSSGGSQGN